MLAAGLGSRVPLTRLSHHDAAKHGYSGVVKESTREWNDALLSSVIDFVCMRVIDIYVYGVDLVSFIFRVHSSTTQRHHLRVHGMVKFGISAVPTTLHRLLTPCYCHFFDQKVMCFLSRTTHVHTWLLRRNVLIVVYNCPGKQDPYVSCQLNTHRT